MRLSDYIHLVERAERITSPDGQPVVLLKNPSREEYEGLIRRIEPPMPGLSPMVRGLLSPFDLYLWDGNLMTHWFMAQALGIDYANFFCCYIERRGDKDVAFSEDDRDPTSLGLDEDFWRMGPLTRIMKKPAARR